jgi:hypothetical protein
MSERIIIENNMLSSKIHWMSSLRIHHLNPETGQAFSFSLRMLNIPDSDIKYIIVPHSLGVFTIQMYRSIVYNQISILTGIYKYILVYEIDEVVLKVRVDLIFIVSQCYVKDNAL